MVTFWKIDPPFKISGCAPGWQWQVLIQCHHLVFENSELILFSLQRKNFDRNRKLEFSLFDRASRAASDANNKNYIAMNEQALWQQRTINDPVRYFPPLPWFAINFMQNRKPALKTAQLWFRGGAIEPIITSTQLEERKMIFHPQSYKLLRMMPCWAPSDLTDQTLWSGKNLKNIPLVQGCKNHGCGICFINNLAASPSLQ